MLCSASSRFACAPASPTLPALISSCRSTGLEAANRWTDNIHLISSFLRNEKGLDRGQVAQFVSQAGIDIDELDYVTRASVLESLKPKPAKGAAKGKGKRTSDA